MKMSKDLRAAAADLRAEIDSRRLRVALACGTVHGSLIRVVEEQNPEWYRRLCAEYETSRTKPRRRRKSDTLIRRASVLRALGEIAAGTAVTIYALRLLPYVEERAALANDLDYQLKKAYGMA